MNFLVVLLMGFSSWLWPLHLSDWRCKEARIVVLYNSPMYAEHCKPLFDAEDEYRWFCIGKWKVPGPCRHYKDEAGIIHSTCVQCYSQVDTGLYSRTECPSMDVDELLEMTGQRVEGER